MTESSCGGLRVLQVNDLPTEPPFGGTEVYVQRIADGLTQSGHHVEVHTRPGPRGPNSKAFTLWDPLERRRLRQHVRTFRPDVIHFNNVFRELSGAVLGATGGTPSVMTVHDQRILGITMGQGSRMRNAIDRAIKQPFDARLSRTHIDVMLAVSGAIRSGLQRAGFPDVRLVHVPATQPFSTVAPSSSRHVVFVGRLARDKGVDALVRAWPMIAEAVSGAHLTIAGDGPLRSELAASAQHLTEITLAGRLDPAGVSKLLASCAVVVVPSLPSVRPEGSPLVAVEAAMHGRPMVVSDDPGLVELAESLANARVFPAGNTDALATAVIALLRDPQERDRLGSSGITASTSHQIEHVVDELLDAYRHAIAARGASMSRTTHIVVDARSTEGEPTGIGVYTRSLLTEWARLPSGRRPNVEELGPSLGVGARWHLRALGIALRRRNAVYFSPDSLIVACILGRRAAVTIHDLAAILHPKLHATRVVIAHRLLMGPAVHRVGAIFVPSEAVERALIAAYPRAAAKTTVISEGSRFGGDGALSEHLSPTTHPRPYVLCVGTVEPRKNTLRLIRAFLEVGAPDWDLVIAGRLGDYSTQQRGDFHQLVNSSGQIRWLGYVPDPELAALYNSASLVAYPSSAEGFGLPVLEAMACGVAVLTTDDPALAELTDDAALRIPAAFEQEELTAALRTLIADPALREDYARRGLARAAPYSWKHSAESALEVLATLSPPIGRR